MNPSDRELLIRAAKGYEKAFAALYHRYAGRLETYLLSRGIDSATVEDVRQKVFLRLLGSEVFANPKEGPKNLEPFLITIARNLVNNEYRNQKRRGRRERGFNRAAPAFEPPPEPELNESLLLAAAINKLPPPQGEVIRLRYRRGWSVAEIADHLDCPAGTVSSRLHYAIRHLRHQLKNHE